MCLITMASKVLLVGLAFLGLSCIATLMFSFMGGYAGSPDASALISLQRAGIVLGAVTVVSCVAFSIRQTGLGGSARALWRHMPGWLVFAGGLLVSLTLMGEIAWVVVHYSTTAIAATFNHVSLICLGTSSLAFMVLFATVHRTRGHPEYSKARW